MKKLSKFDLIMIIIFVAVGLLGAGVWWYLAGKLDEAKQKVAAASADFDKYTAKATYLPTSANEKILQANVDLTKSLLDPLIQAKLQSTNNKIFSVSKQDPVAWKHDLDERVGKLNAAAKLHGVNVPAHFYYSFSRYLNSNPGDEKTVILTKQLLGIEQIATILINAPVQAIVNIRRTYDEDDQSGNRSPNAGAGDKDRLNGRVVNVDGNVYADYPFEIDIDASPDSLRKIMDDLLESPYVFVVRNVVIHNSKLNSPQLNDLDQLAGGQSFSSVAESSPGAVAADAKSAKGPQFLFGGETLHIQLRIDMIEWKGLAASDAPSNKPAPRNRTPAPGSK